MASPERTAYVVGRRRLPGAAMGLFSKVAGTLQDEVVPLTNPPLLSAEKRTAELPAMFRRYRADITEGLRRRMSRDDLGVYDMLRYYLGWVDRAGEPCTATEGKALRPTLCLFACEATGGAPGRVMPGAVGLEFIHNFSLIHDDIQDRDETRHHRPTLWAVWGVPRAVVAGNVLRISADMSLQGLVDEGVELERALEVIALLTEAYLEMIEGQYLDLSYEGRLDIGIGDYLNMISRKTGALIRCSLNIGAVVGSRDPATVAAFRTSGTSLGYVFQIRDDVLGVWGDEETTGKPVGADIRRKKNSFPVVHAMSRATGDDKRLLVKAYQKEQLDDEDVSVVLEVMERAETRDSADRLAAEYCDKALEALAGVELAPDIRQEMEELAHFLLVRQH